jgi:hypothetical protein
MALTRKEILKSLLPSLNKMFGIEYGVKPDITYHARRTDENPKIWKVVEVHTLYDEVKETKELATDLKRNRAEALVKLLRGNQKHGS